MATLIAKADGNLTGAATFAAAETGALALVLNRHTATALAAASTTTSPAFTVTAGAVIDAVLLWLKLDGTSTAGTFKVDLQKGGVSQGSVTVNKTDLPPYNATTGVTPSPMLFKLGTTATGDGAANWTIVLTAAGGGNNVSVYMASAVVTNFTRALRTTTAATPAAGDNLYIAGELTGAGTHNSRAVIMDSTAITAYGNNLVNSTTVAGGLVAVTCWASLTYPTTPATNSILRIAGDLAVYANCSLTIGSPGAEIPRDSTAILEFQQVAADGDFGLRCMEHSVINIAGLSRTAGKNVTQCKLTANAPSNSVLNVGGFVNATQNTVLDASGTSYAAFGAIDNTTSGWHGLYWSGSSVTNVVQTVTAWIARGTGTNNRYFRLSMGNATSPITMVNGFYCDFDLQAGTAGSVVSVGNGVGTSVSMTPVGRGFLLKMTGKVSTAAATPSVHLAACAVAGTVSYVGNTTQCFHYYNVAVVNAASISDTVFNVDTDTGWLANDVVCVASTYQIPGASAPFQLNADAGASSFTTPVYVGNGTGNYTYHGTPPLVAEVGLITRNVKVRAIGVNQMAYVYVTAQATFTASWAEFGYIGANLANKRGIEIEGGTTAVTNPNSITYCSIHDCDYNGLYCATSTGALRLTFTNNVCWMNGSGAFITISGSVSQTDWIINDNLIMRCTSGISLGDLGGAFNDNTVVGSTGTGIYMSEIGALSYFTSFNNNTAHSGGTSGFSFGTSGVPVINATNIKAWRNGNYGLDITNTSSAEMTFDGVTLFGNGSPTTGANIRISSDVLRIIGANNIICSDTSYPVAYGIYCDTANMTNIFDVSNADMVGGTGIYTPHAIFDLNFYYFANPKGHFNNCKFGAPALFDGKGGEWNTEGYLGFQKFNQVVGDYRCEMTWGVVRSDNAVFRTATPSMRMIPYSSSKKLESAPLDLGIFSAVANGNAVTASVWIKKDGNYLGNQPRLIVRANNGLGIVYDTVLATSDSPSSTMSPVPWEAATIAGVTLSGSNLVATNTGTTASNQGAHVAFASAKDTGRFYFEVVLTTWAAGGNVGVGIGNTSAVYSNLGTSSTGGSMMYMSSGNIWSNGGNTGISLGARVSTNTICVAVDLDLRRIWFRPTSAGLWNNNAAFDPTNNIGGISVPTGSMVPFVTFGGTSGVANNVFTANFGQTPFIGAVPAGFLPGWLIPDGLTEFDWVKMTGTTPVANDDGFMEFIVDCDGGTGFINVDDWGFTSSLGASTNELKYWINGLPSSGGGGAGGAYFSAGFF